jgi:DNA-binding CsgD family transcriptional regulator
MVKLIIITAFVICVALTAGGILLSSKLRSSLKTDCFSTLMYYQTFYFTFGFYAIWGQVILISLLGLLISKELMQKIATFLVLLGTPFILFTWLMLLKFTRELAGGKTGTRFIFWYLFGNLLFALGVGFGFPAFATFESFTLVKSSFIILNFAYTVTGILFLLYPRKKKALLRKTDRNSIAAGLLVFMLLQNIILLAYQGNAYSALLFIFFFFTGGVFLPVYIRYKADLSILWLTTGDTLTFEAFCRNFEISPREQDIIREICHGLSNQQIADKLFISLQTVKDHTSRIYFKTNCTSRAMLIAMLSESTR